jgi:hypothetical protein
MIQPMFALFIESRLVSKNILQQLPAQFRRHGLVPGYILTYVGKKK